MRKDREFWIEPGKRVAATVAFLWALNFVALVGIAVGMMITGHGNEPVPDWFNSWFGWSVFFPIVVVILGGIFLLGRALVRYWRR